MSVMYCHTLVSPGMGATLHTWAGREGGAGSGGRDARAVMLAVALCRRCLCTVHLLRWHHMNAQHSTAQQHSAAPPQPTLGEREPAPTFLERSVLMTELFPTLG